MFVCSRYHEESLRPPPESGSGDGERDCCECGEALIDILAYMVDERNHTTARCPFRATAAGTTEELQVTFCLAPPPHISHFSVAYTSGEPTRFISEPLILATAGNLALISVKQGPTWLPRSTDYTYLVYHAAPTPALSVLPLPKPELFPEEEHCYLVQGEVGILPYKIQEAPGHSQQEAYKIATLLTPKDDEACRYNGTKNVDLNMYDSNTDAWTREPTVFSQEPAPPSFCSDRVITVGGTIIWVDLSQGMILCQVPLSGDEESSSSPGPRQLRYIRLPKPLQPRDHLPICISTSSFSRDINIVDGRISFVDLEIHASPGSLLPNCWTAITWSMAVSDSEFHKVREVKSAQVASVAALDPQSFFVAHPTLSSHNGDILYLMAKTTLDPLDNHSSVIAVDMRCRKMERVAKYTTQRGGSMDFAYMLTTISKYLAPPGDSNAIPKKRGPAFLGSSSRKEAAFTLPRYGGDQVDDERVQMEAFLGSSSRKAAAFTLSRCGGDQRVKKDDVEAFLGSSSRKAAAFTWPRYGGDQMEDEPVGDVDPKEVEAFLGSSSGKAAAFTLPRYGGDQVEDEEEAFLGSSSRKAAAFTLSHYGGVQVVEEDDVEGVAGVQVVEDDDVEAVLLSFSRKAAAFTLPRYGGDHEPVGGEVDVFLGSSSRKAAAFTLPRYGGDQVEDEQVEAFMGSSSRKLTSLEEVWPEEDHEDKLPKVKRMFLSRKV